MAILVCLTPSSMPKEALTQTTSSKANTLRLTQPEDFSPSSPQTRMKLRVATVESAGSTAVVPPAFACERLKRSPVMETSFELAWRMPWSSLASHRRRQKVCLYRTLSEPSSGDARVRGYRDVSVGGKVAKGADEAAGFGPDSCQSQWNAGELDVTARNAPAQIGGRAYSGHALDRMQGRGLTPSVVEDAITHGQSSAGRGGRTIHYSSANHVSVVVGRGGRVVTAVRGRVTP